MRTIIVEDGKKLLGSRKGAIMTPVTKADQFKTGEQWTPVGDLAHNAQVQAVRHFGRHTSEIGERLIVESDEEERIGTFEVMSIRLVETAQLTDADAALAGYASLAALLERVGTRRMWFLEVLPSPTSRVL